MFGTGRSVFAPEVRLWPPDRHLGPAAILALVIPAQRGLDFNYSPTKLPVSGWNQLIWPVSLCFALHGAVV